VAGQRPEPQPGRQPAPLVGAIIQAHSVGGRRSAQSSDGGPGQARLKAQLRDWQTLVEEAREAVQETSQSVKFVTTKGSLVWMAAVPKQSV